jgi:hypothetical protein
MKWCLKIALTVVAITLASFSSFAQKPPAVTPGVLPAYITAGLIDPNGKVPVLNGIQGAGVPSLSEAMPMTVLIHGTSYSYLIALQDYNYTGTIVASYKLTQVQAGKTVTLDSGAIKSFSSAPGNVWAWVTVGKAIPNSAGVATLTGSVKYGTTTTSTKTVVILQ